MLWRKFGLAEAKKADEFVKTEDQRRVVLGIARMFNIPVTVQKDAVVRCKSIKSSVRRNTATITRLGNDLRIEELARDVNVKMNDEVNEVSGRWAL